MYAPRTGAPTEEGNNPCVLLEVQARQRGAPVRTEDGGGSVTEHTPGPWHVSTRYLDAWAVLDARGFGIEDAPMSILEGWSDLGYKHWGNAPGVTFIERSHIERAANARLIAAAPDLLTALQSALSEHDCDWNGCWCERAREAIRKAS